jgi:hypothetical protein
MQYKNRADLVGARRRTAHAGKEDRLQSPVIANGRLARLHLRPSGQARRLSATTAADGCLPRLQDAYLPRLPKEYPR